MNNISAKEYFFSKVTEKNGCLLWHKADVKGGYGRSRFNGERMLAHRFSWKIHFSDPPKNMEVCHKCDTPLCVNPDHLFLGTHKENMLDASSKKRIKGPQGEKAYNAKINDLIATEILNSELPGNELAEKYSLTRDHISKIRKGKAWSHVNDLVKVSSYKDGRSLKSERMPVIAIISDPAGNQFNVTSINAFAKNNGIGRESLRRLIRGKCESFKGWKLFRDLEPEQIESMAECMVDE